MKLHFMTGAGLGLLVGILTGMSLSPVVGPLLGALTAAAIIFLGFKESIKESIKEKVQAGGSDTTAESKSLSKSKAPSYRIIGFCFAAVIGVLGGAYLKSQDLFKVTPRQQIQELMEAGFSTNEAKSVVLNQASHISTGLVIGGGDAGTNPAFHIPTALYGGQLTGVDFNDYEPSRFPDASSAIKAYKDAGGVWYDVAVTVESKVPENQRMQVLTYFWEFLRKQSAPKP
jgi:hypothetical protein